MFSHSACGLCVSACLDRNVVRVTGALGQRSRRWYRGPLKPHYRGRSTSNWLLDDFVIPAGQTWEITDIEWTHAWATGNGGFDGSGVSMFFRYDSTDTPGTPGDPFPTTVTNVSYSEVLTGNTFDPMGLNLPEESSSAIFEPVVLGAGTYWLQARIISFTGTNYWLTRQSVTGSPLWISYSSFGLLPGTDLFGVDEDLNFKLTGNIISAVPEPTTLLLLGAGLGIAAYRRRRKVRR